MKRVAFCLLGAISKDNRINAGAFVKENSLYSSEEYIDYVKCRNSIFKNIVLPNPNYQIDFFCHGWNYDLEDEINHIYNPKSILMEDNGKYADEIKKRCQQDNDFGGISQSLSIRKSLILKEEYEEKNNFKYDVVILYRYDVLLWKHIILDTYDLNDTKIYANGRKTNDFHFIMNNSNSAILKELFDSPLKGNNQRAHHWIPNYIENFCHKKVVADTIIPGKHQEVIRKIKKFSINKGHLLQKDYDNI